MHKGDGCITRILRLSLKYYYSHVVSERPTRLFPDLLPETRKHIFAIKIKKNKTIKKYAYSSTFLFPFPRSSARAYYTKKYPPPTIPSCEPPRWSGPIPFALANVTGWSPVPPPQHPTYWVRGCLFKPPFGF